MAANRLDRELENRETTARKKSWSRPTVLPDPIPQDGYKFHWVRVSTMGQPDSTKVKVGSQYAQKTTPRYLVTPFLTRVSKIMSSLAD
jgi:hypothetical protein